MSNAKVTNLYITKTTLRNPLVFPQTCRWSPRDTTFLKCRLVFQLSELGLFMTVSFLRGFCQHIFNIWLPNLTLFLAVLSASFQGFPIVFSSFILILLQRCSDRSCFLWPCWFKSSLSCNTVLGFSPCVTNPLLSSFFLEGFCFLPSTLQQLLIGHHYWPTDSTDVP